MYYEERPPLVTVATVGGKYHTTVNFSIEPSGEGFEVESVTVVTDEPLSSEHYSMLVGALVRARYTADDEFDVADYVAYNAYVEKCKEIACSVLGTTYVPNVNPTMAEVMTQLRTLMKPYIEVVEDETAVTVPALFDPWAPGIDVVKDERRYYASEVYRCIQGHRTQADWTPDVTPALWAKVSVDEWPEWVQPTGAHDAYNTGDKVTYNGKHYVSVIDGNIWAPDAYPAGWSEQV